MNKLKLNLDALEVASFATQTPAADTKGTVAANSEPVTIAVTIAATTGLISYYFCTASE